VHGILVPFLRGFFPSLLLLTIVEWLAFPQNRALCVGHDILFRGYLLTRSQPANSKHTLAQHKWLTEKFPQFLQHQANKTGGQFFPSLYEEYFAQWPPTPTEEDLSKAKGNIAVATAAIQQLEEKVRNSQLRVSMND
jgi:hypothetical protein